MRASKSLVATTREVPGDAELISHQLMLRAGLIRKLGSGLYSWLPLGMRVLSKVTAIIKEEMDRIGTQEVLMPAIQPVDLWQESGRWSDYGPMMLTMKDRHDREFCFGPTHEEVVTDLARREFNSYKQLPQSFYQVQVKFRDELRPRFGVMRAREFIMKDAYSFHLTPACLSDGYDAMYNAYHAIFTRLGLEYRVVLADSGEIGGDKSQEFHVLAQSGEDVLAYSTKGDYAANIERATCALPPMKPSTPLEMSKCETPGIKSVPQQAKYMKLHENQIIKTLLVRGTDTKAVALLVRGDHTINELKVQKMPEVSSPFEMLPEHELEEITHCSPGFCGPIGLNIPILADHSVLQMQNFSCGANETDWHYINVNWDRDCPAPEGRDLRNVVSGDLSPDGQGTLELCRGIEVGHIFQLGTKYSEAMNAQVLDDAGQRQYLYMGCYGIGVTRIVAAAIEQNHDEYGIIWPEAISPYHIALVALGYEKSAEVKKTADHIYEALTDAGIDVFFDDRSERPGVMFADQDLMGIPHRLIIGDRGLKEGTIEYKSRKTGTTNAVPVSDVLDFVTDLFS